MLGDGTLLTSETVLVRRSEPIAALVDGKVVLLSVEAGAYFGLNRVGSAIWNMLERPCRVGNMLDTLAQTHHADCDTVTRDVIAFLDTLIKRRLARAITPGDVP